MWQNSNMKIRKAIRTDFFAPENHIWAAASIREIRDGLRDTILWLDCYAVAEHNGIDFVLVPPKKTREQDREHYKGQRCYRYRERYVAVISRTGVPIEQAFQSLKGFANELNLLSMESGRWPVFNHCSYSLSRYLPHESDPGTYTRRLLALVNTPRYWNPFPIVKNRSLRDFYVFASFFTGKDWTVKPAVSLPRESAINELVEFYARRKEYAAEIGEFLAVFHCLEELYRGVKGKRPNPNDIKKWLKEHEDEIRNFDIVIYMRPYIESARRQRQRQDYEQRFYARLKKEGLYGIYLKYQEKQSFEDHEFPLFIKLQQAEKIRRATYDEVHRTRSDYNFIDYLIDIRSRKAAHARFISEGVHAYFPLSAIHVVFRFMLNKYVHKLSHSK